jgi:hypothetical protein
MAKYADGKQGPSFSGNYFNPQEIGFSEAPPAGPKILPAEPGVKEGTSAIAMQNHEPNTKNS